MLVSATEDHNEESNSSSLSKGEQLDAPSGSHSSKEIAASNEVIEGVFDVNCSEFSWRLHQATSERFPLFCRSTEALRHRWTKLVTRVPWEYLAKGQR